MDFEITHSTDYAYANAAAEAYLEVRLAPPDEPGQTVVRRRLDIVPAVRTSAYTDFFGNGVEFFSLPYRHKSLSITSRVEVRTRKVELPANALEVSVNEARQLLSGAPLADVFDYVQPTEVVLTGREAIQWAKRYLPGREPLATALFRLQHEVYTQFEYKSGATDNSTPLHQIWQTKRGVCQDFAHVMISVLRTAGLPARYVCGYIEAVAPPEANTERDLPARGAPRTTLVGAIATHAWVEVLVPGLTWVALDPTNDQWCGERHVAVSRGRDFRDATPVRGTFKGSGKQRMKVKVFMRRRAIDTSASDATVGAPKPA